MSHCIRQCHFHLAFNGTEAAGLALQRTLPDLCTHRLMPALEPVLERHAPAAGVLSIDWLDIDAGVLSLERLAQDLPDLLAHALEKQLREYLSAGKHSQQTASVTGSPIRFKTPQQSLHEAFMHFLQTGRLPWSFQLPTGKNLEQTLLEAWQQSEPATTDHNDDAFPQTMLLQTLTSPTARQRLTRQFSPLFLQTLVTRLSTDSRPVVDQVLQALPAAITSTTEASAVTRLVWEVVFAQLAHTPLDSVLTAPALASQFFQEYPQYFPRLTQDSLLANTGEQQRSATTQQNTHEPASQVKQKLNDMKHGATTQQNTHEPISHVYPRQMKTRFLTSSEETEHSDAIGIHKTVLAQTTPNVSEPHGLEITQHNTSTPSLRPHSPSVSLLSPTNDPTRLLASSQAETDGFYIGNAGLVLLHPFLPHCFNTLGIAVDEQLVEANRAICLLHFMATGQTTAPEYALTLPKILCNLPLDMPVEADSGLTPRECEEASALLTAVIHHWEALKNTSVDGLRGTFLLRNGKISQRNDGDWLLQVETQTFDILLDQLPWGIGMVKLPWMPHLLWTEWR